MRVRVNVCVRVCMCVCVYPRKINLYSLSRRRNVGKYLTTYTDHGNATGARHRSTVMEENVKRELGREREKEKMKKKREKKNRRGDRKRRKTVIEISRASSPLLVLRFLPNLFLPQLLPSPYPSLFPIPHFSIYLSSPCPFFPIFPIPLFLPYPPLPPPHRSAFPASPLPPHAFSLSLCPFPLAMPLPCNVDICSICSHTL